MKKFRCTACNYEFNSRTRGKEGIPNRCPYCGKKEAVVEKKHILEEI